MNWPKTAMNSSLIVSFTFELRPGLTQVCACNLDHLKSSRVSRLSPNLEGRYALHLVDINEGFGRLSTGM